MKYTHDCTDGSDAPTEALAAESHIAHVRFEPKAPKPVKCRALKSAYKDEWYRSTDWALFFDCEELVCKRSRSFPNHMEREIGLTCQAKRNRSVERFKEILGYLDTVRPAFCLSFLPGSTQPVEDDRRVFIAAQMQLLQGQEAPL